MTLPGALIYDFDGLILDTETCTYDAVRSAFAEHGQELDVAAWQAILGSADHPHWTDMLATRLGRPVDREALTARREEQRMAVLLTLPPCAGVERLLDAAVAAGVPNAVGSSSAARWVVGHLERLGLRERFAVVATSDDVGGDPRRTKPAPDIFLAAAGSLGVDPGSCVVLEDSPNGVLAARAAGMPVVAVPGPMTRGLDFDGADLIVPSLVGLSLGDLGALVH
ncbi:MAG TPA: HAD family hydrolase [Acidimicrobiales bacterium]|nr:HAD family hydrolase [Acidimicrobiales bacterium]